MPMPKPSKDEAKKDFISRFMGDSEMVKDYPDEKQRSAVAYSEWKRHLKANGLVDTFKANMAPMVGEVEYDGRKHISAPAVMLIPSVMNGVLVTEDVAAKFPETWNGMPVTLGHPMKNNQFVDANQPDMLEKYRIGQLFGCKWEDGKLKGMAYIDPEILGKKNKTVLDRIKDNQVIEVSTGFFSDDDPTPGEADGVQYEVKANVVYPNHFAILPTGIGACSVAKGAGIPRVNQDQENATMTESVKNFFKSLKDMLSRFDDNAEVVLETESVPAPNVNQEQSTQDQGVNTMETPAPAVQPTETPAPTPKVMTEQEIKAMIDKGIKDGIEQSKKAELIAKIKANEKNKLPDSALNAMSSDELLVACKDLIPADFGGLPPPNLKNNEDDGVIPDAPPCFLAQVK